MTPQELRSSIFRFAISGKLTKQNELEDSKSVIESALAARKKAENKSLIKKEKKTALISDDEMPFDIPKNWTWVRLIQISSIEAGGTPDRGTPEYWNGTVPWLKIGDIDKKYVTKCSEYITELGLENSSAKIFKKGTILYTIFATIGRVGILDFDASTNQAIAGITFYGELNTDYLFYVLVSLKDVLVAQSHGMAQMNINQAILKQTPIPIPPLEEQNRIVEKIEELLPLVDRYEEAWNKLESLNANFPNSLQKSVIQFGMEGKLTTRIGDEDVDLFLKDCLRFKEKLNEDGVLKGRKVKPLSPVSQEEYPHEIPTHWRWCRLGLVCEIFGRIGFRGYTTSDIVEKGKGAITISPSNLNNDGTTDFSSCTYLSWFKYEESPEIMVFDNDILLVKTGSSYGKSALVTSLPEKATINPQLAILKYVCADKKFLNYALMSMSSQKQFKEFVVGTSIPTFSQEKLANLLIPIPPLEEQKRIVTKIEELLPLCRKLIR